MTLPWTTLLKIGVSHILASMTTTRSQTKSCPFSVMVNVQLIPAHKCACFDFLELNGNSSCYTKHLDSLDFVRVKMDFIGWMNLMRRYVLLWWFLYRPLHTLTTFHWNACDMFNILNMLNMKLHLAYVCGINFITNVNKLGGSVCWHLPTWNEGRHMYALGGNSARQFTQITEEINLN